MPASLADCYAFQGERVTNTPSLLPPPSKRPIQVLSLPTSGEERLEFLLLNGASINFVMFAGMGYNINFEHTRVTILTEKQVFLERVSLQMENPFLYNRAHEKEGGWGGGGRGRGVLIPSSLGLITIPASLK